MGGIVGRFMKSFGLTMAFAIMVSLLVSFTLTPMLSARWLKVEPHGKDAALVEGLEGLPRDRRVLHAAARVVDGAPRDRRRRRGAGAAVERAAVHDREQELHAAGRSVGVRDQPARAGRHQPRIDRGPDQPRRQRGPAAAAGGRLHAGHRSAAIRRKTRNLGNDLRPAEADRGSASAISSRSWTIVRNEILPPLANGPAHVGAAGRRRSAAAARRTPTCSS